MTSQQIDRIIEVLAYIRGGHRSKVDLLSLKAQAYFIATHINQPNRIPLDSILKDEKIRHYVMTGEMT